MADNMNTVPRRVDGVELRSKKFAAESKVKTIECGLKIYHAQFKKLKNLDTLSWRSLTDNKNRYERLKKELIDGRQEIHKRNLTLQRLLDRLDRRSDASAAAPASSAPAALITPGPSSSNQ